MGFGIPAGIGGEHPGRIWNECCLFRADAADQFDVAGIRVAFDVEFSVYYRAQIEHILIADVALVRTRVDGDALGSEALAVDGHFDDVGVIASARIADGGDFVDING